MNEITFQDFTKLDLRVGTVIKVEEPEWSNKLLQLTVDFGETSSIGERVVFSGIRKWYGVEDVQDKQFIFITNLPPKKMGPAESQGMMLMADTVNGNPGDQEKPTLIPLTTSVENGTVVR